MDDKYKKPSFSWLQRKIIDESAKANSVISEPVSKCIFYTSYIKGNSD